LDPIDIRKTIQIIVITRPHDSLLSSKWSTSHDSLPFSAADEIKVKENAE
jgi:hypothetical protein